MLTVLIADQHATTAQHLAAILSRAGHRCACALDLRIVLEEWCTPPDVLLLNVDFAGGELLRRLPHLPNTNTVTAVGITGPGSSLGARSSVLVSLLRTPVSPSTLLAAVNDAGRGRARWLRASPLLDAV